MHIQITILDGHTGINLDVWYPWLAGHEFTKIYTRLHKMSFIHVHMIQRPKAIHVYGYKSVEEPVKAKKCTISSIYLLFSNIKRLLINA